MNRTTAIIIGIVALAAIVAIGLWVALGSAPIPTAPTNTNTTQTPSSGEELEPEPAANAPQSTTAKAVIVDKAFSPATLTVKKGTTVTWTNQDDMGHNVVSDDAAPEGGPPKEAGLFGKGETFSFTYNTVGTFPYHCSPHPFMQGTVVVTE